MTLHDAIAASPVTAAYRSYLSEPIAADKLVVANLTAKMSHNGVEFYLIHAESHRSRP